MSYYFKSYLTTFHGTYNKRTAITGPIGSMAKIMGILQISLIVFGRAIWGKEVKRMYAVPTMKSLDK